MLPVNPFGTSMTIREPEQFFGRIEALDYLYSEIVSRRCVSVVGTRRIGKSSLLRCMCLPQIQEPFQSLYNLEKYLLVFIDLSEFLSKIQQRLEHMVNEVMGGINSRYALMQNYRILSNRPPIIYLIFSLCGGTGSSLFFDVAYVLRQMLTVKATIVGVAMLPSPYIPDLTNPQKERVQANTYAAMQELECLHKMAIGQGQWTNGTDLWNVDYPNNFHVSSNELPFDYLYLVDDITMQGERYTRGEIYKSLGKAIFWLAGPNTASTFWERAVNHISQSRDRLALGMPQDASGGDDFCEVSMAWKISLRAKAITTMKDYLELLPFDEFMALRNPREIRNQRFSVLFLDEFDQLTSNIHFDVRFFSFLLAQANHGRVSNVTSSVVPLDQCCYVYIEGSPFFNIFSVYRLGALINVAGGHPFYIQMMSRCLFDEEVRQDNEIVDLSLVQERVYHELDPHFVNAWNDLSDDQKESLKSELTQSIPEHRKMSEPSECSLFRKKVREFVPDLSLKDLKDVLDNMEDNDLLANSRLADIHYVTLSTKANPQKKKVSSWRFQGDRSRAMSLSKQDLPQMFSLVKHYSEERGDSHVLHSRFCRGMCFKKIVTSSLVCLFILIPTYASN